MDESKQTLNIEENITTLEDRVSNLSLDKKKEKSDKKIKKELSSDIKILEDKKKEKSGKKELSSDIKILEDKKKKPIKKIEEKKNILCGFPLITKKGEKCTNKGLLDCGGRCKMHNGK